MREVRANPDSARDQLVFALAANIVGHCQAAEKLCFRGMKTPGRAVLRCAVEAIFSLGALVRAKKNLRRVRLKYLIEYKKQLEFLAKRNNGRDGQGNDRSSDLPKIQREINRYRRDRRKVHVSELAALAGMTDVYEIRYYLLSEAVHADPTALLRMHVPHEKNAFRFEPEDDVALQMGELLETLGKTARALTHHFHLDDAGYREFEPRLIAAINEVARRPIAR